MDIYMMAGISRTITTLAEHMSDTERRAAAAELRSIEGDDATVEFYQTTAAMLDKLAGKGE